MGSTSHPTPLANTLRQRWLFWPAVAGLIALFPFFFVGGPVWNDGPLFKAAWNLGHPIAFVLIALVTRPWQYLSGWRLWCVSTFAALTLGLVIEFIQSFASRQIGVHDLARNLMGLWIILACLPNAGFITHHPARRWLLGALAGLLLASEIAVVASVAVRQYQISQWLPQLYDFQQADPGYYWSGRISPAEPERCGAMTSQPLMIELSTRRYSGASLHNLPKNWQGYGGLKLAFWNPQDHPISITLRINDRAHERDSNVYHDRFNQRFTLSPGANRLMVSLSSVENAPRDRSMDMDDIRRLMVFTSNLAEPGQLCLVELALTDGHDEPGAFD